MVSLGDVNKARTLWPLPGGSGAYLRSLRLLLVEADKNRTADEMTSFIIRKFPNVTSRKAAKSYFYVTTVLGLTSLTGGRTRLTERGRSFVETKSSDVVLNAVIDNVAGVDEIIEFLSEEPRRIGLLLTAMNSVGYEWRTDSQLRYRLQWLEECGAIEKLGRGRPIYVLTDETLARKPSANVGFRAPKLGGDCKETRKSSTRPRT
jgi:hypothetical protein